jgi:hypothetical protein
LKKRETFLAYDREVFTLALGSNSNLDSNKGFLKFPISGLNHYVRVSSKDLFEEHFMSLLSLFFLVFQR